MVDFYFFYLSLILPSTLHTYTLIYSITFLFSFQITNPLSFILISTKTVKSKADNHIAKSTPGILNEIKSMKCLVGLGTPADDQSQQSSGVVRPFQNNSLHFIIILSPHVTIASSPFDLPIFIISHPELQLHIFTLMTGPSMDTDICLSTLITTSALDK